MDNTAGLGAAMEASARREENKSLEQRVAALEALVACPRCRGRGSVMTHWGQDECPACHGTKINPVLLPH